MLIDANWEWDDAVTVETVQFNIEVGKLFSLGQVEVRQPEHDSLNIVHDPGQ